MPRKRNTRMVQNIDYNIISKKQYGDSGIHIPYTRPNVISGKRIPIFFKSKLELPEPEISKLKTGQIGFSGINFFRQA